MAKGKQPSFKVHLANIKAPSTQEEVDTEDKNISWRVGMMDQGGDFGWGSATSQLLWSEVWLRMEDFEKKTFAKLNKKKHHPVLCSDLTKKAKDRLKAIDREDVEKLFSLYLRKRLRIFGIREGNVLKLLWLDTDHGVVDSTKSNT